MIGFQTYSQLQEIFGKVGAARIAAGLRGPSVSADVQTRPLVTPPQFQTLPERTAYARFSDFPPTRLDWPARSYPSLNSDARHNSELTSKPWLGSIVVSQYCKSRDQARTEFLDEMKADVNRFLSVFHYQVGSEWKALLQESIQKCKRILGEASPIKESFDGEIFEIPINAGHLVVIRSSTKVTLPLPSESAQADGSAVLRPKPDDTLE